MAAELGRCQSGVRRQNIYDHDTNTTGMYPFQTTLLMVCVNMSSRQLNFLKTLILWSLSSSDGVQAIIKESYKQSRHDDDLNQPLSVQPWGRDGEKRRYWLIEGQDDTHFRLYRESNPAGIKNRTWWSIAGDIEELKTAATGLQEDGGQAARRLGERIMAAIPRFEATEEVLSS
jgi:hypothetical protein